VQTGYWPPDIPYDLDVLATVVAIADEQKDH